MRVAVEAMEVERAVEAARAAVEAMVVGRVVDSLRSWDRTPVVCSL